MTAPATESIALFGGTFDPIHRGHLELAGLAREACGLDRVIFVPCARSPFKESGTVASADQRCEMASLAIADAGAAPWASVSRFEVDRPPPSYSWLTAAHFRECHPGASLHWIVGGDQWEQLDRWAEAGKLRDWLTFVVVARKGSPLRPRPGWRAAFLEFDHPASATAIREGRGERSWLTDSVVDFCRDAGLYGIR